ncbi:MAG: putative drug exporter of the superfamily [Chloroflexota bacterium]|jgi:RND superfamily putative drug exporter|nr:putative drug exporter of the superfamily [Chloroflexota bacterium]
MLFSRWGAFVHRFRRPIVAITIVLAVASLSLASRVTGSLVSGGWTDPHSESTAVATRLAEEFGTGRGSIVAVFQGGPAIDARSDAFQEQIATSLRRLATDPIADGTIGFAQTRDARFIATDGHSAYAVVRLSITDEQASNEMPRIRGLIDQPPAGTKLSLAGVGPFTEDQAHQSEKELVQAELVSGPFALLILLAVFASVVAAGLPLLVAALAIPTTLAGVFLVAQTTELSIYVQNVATMLGLALAIDYSLFMVSRFREELRRGRTVAQAVETTVATSGKAVAFSGLAVAIGLSGLLLFQPAALRSFGIGGSIVVASSVFYALTFLPAVLGMLGHRVNSLSLAGLFDAIRRRAGRPVLARSADPSRSRWAQVARAVMSRPLAFLVPAVLFLLLAGSPFLRLSQGIPNAATLPEGLESRDAAVSLSTDFAAGETSPMTILATVAGDPLSAANIGTLTSYAASIDAVAGIDRVEGPLAVADPATGAAMSAEQLAAFYAAPTDLLPPQLAAARDQLRDAYVRGSTVRFDAVSPLDPVSPAGGAVVPAVRAVATSGVTAQVGGIAAEGHDFMVSQGATVPYAVGVTLFASGVILFLLFGSVVIPLKAIVMTLLSITASFGALVWIFQDGNLSNVLGFTSPGFTVAGNPIIMFSILFGLSMDYEVLLLSRVQEAYRRTGDNTASVAEGLSRTAGVITGAALIMVVVFSAFALAESITIKSIGVGMAIAVLVDATIIRVLLVPAAMRLMGRWNWWAPGPLGRFAARLGFSHEDEPAGAAPGGDAPGGEPDDADGPSPRPATRLVGS